MSEYSVRTSDNLGSFMTDKMVVRSASGSLAWAEGRKINASLWKDVELRHIDTGTLVFRAVHQ